MRTYGIFILSMLAMSVYGQMEEDVQVAVGSTYNGSIQTQNADITVLDNAWVKDNVTSVHGNVTVESGGRVKGIETTNGDIFIGENATIDRSIETVNGSIRIKAGTEVKRDVISLTGDVRIYGAVIKQNIEIRDGSLMLKDGALVKGNVTVLDRGGNSGNAASLNTVDIYVGAGSVIRGDVSADSQWDRVELEINGGEIQGDVDDDIRLIDPQGDDQEDEEDDEDEDEDGKQDKEKK